MDTSNMNQQTAILISAALSSSNVNKIIYSAPASPASPAAAVVNIAAAEPTAVNVSSPAPGTTTSSAVAGPTTTSPTSSHSTLSTPKKDFLDAIMLQTIREKLRTPGGCCELHSLRLERNATGEPLTVVKDRYLISQQPNNTTAKAPVSYRHLIDLTSNNLKCTDVFTEEQFLCKIINEPLHKVQRAYFDLLQEEDQCRSSIYGHVLIRGVHDIVPMAKYQQRCYIIISKTPKVQAPWTVLHDDGGAIGIYEDLHTYIRNKRRLSESEARALFHQICETVQICHRNGIILRDLKLKRFYFIDEARTKLQYESLEGSMILDNPSDDTLSDKIGCPLYTAPELLCPNPTYKGKPADMWSLGVILYTMLVGQYPFYEKGNCNLITIIRHSPLQIPLNISKSARWLLLQLLRKNYEERMCAEYIFLSPWLKDQRPYYMHISADVNIPDDEEEEEEGKQQRGHRNTAAGCIKSSYIGCETEQPLDYSRTTLQLDQHCNYSSSGSSQGDMDVDDDDDGEVEMG